jgi:hypothetical protein
MTSSFERAQKAFAMRYALRMSYEGIAARLDESIPFTRDLVKEGWKLFQSAERKRLLQRNLVRSALASCALAASAAIWLAWH